MENDSNSSLNVTNSVPRQRKGAETPFLPPRGLSSSSPPLQEQYYQDAAFGKDVKVGLTIAGVASTLLTTIFGIFHVDLFLRAYQLPLATYSFGNFVYSIINTANDVAGAWLVDHVAMRRQRTDLVGLSGLIFCLCFLTPFFRWRTPAPGWDGMHFVLSLSLYDTLYSFTAILMGSVVTDNHHMTDQVRVQFMASGKLANLLASFVVARIGLAVFDENNLYQFRVFLGALVVLVGGLFILGQAMILGTASRTRYMQQLRQIICPPATMLPLYNEPPTLPLDDDSLHFDTGGPHQSNSDDSVKSKKQFRWRRILSDFWCHKNFRAWIGMEMLLEAQMTFINFFLKTFIDRLVHEHGGVSRATCDWWISMIRPLRQMAAIGSYVPIRMFGYARVYRIVFAFNLLLSLGMLTLTNESCTSCLLGFVLVYPVLTGAIQSAGFHLAMSDMVTELKRDRLLAGRLGEPSVAGMFMGVNALLCKPMESLLPIIAASVLDRGGDQMRSLFYLLVVPPAVCAVLQLASWSQYDLAPVRTARIRRELQDLIRDNSWGKHTSSDEEEDMVMMGTHEN